MTMKPIRRSRSCFLNHTPFALVVMLSSRCSWLTAFSPLRCVNRQQQHAVSFYKQLLRVPTRIQSVSSSSSATTPSSDTATKEQSAAVNKNKKNRILSGVQPTGSLHLGNYLGAIQQWVGLQNNDTETFFCVVDLHAITVQPHDPQQLYESTLASAALYLAAGVDPTKSKIFVQSHVPAHAELAWLLQCLTPVNWLERMIQYKEKSSSSTGASTGLLTYPVLMAADILLYQATLVPVGEDQRQHLELARDICRRVHDMYGSGNAYKKRLKQQQLSTRSLFTEPQALILKDTTARIMSLTDGTKKMSKSDPSEASRINLLDPPSVIRKKIKSAKSDSGFGGIYPDIDKRPEATNLVQLYCAVQPDQDREALLKEVSTMQWGEFKPRLADAVIAHLEPIQEKYKEIRADPDYVPSVLREGAEAARAVADTTVLRTKAALGLYPNSSLRNDGDA